MKVTITRKTEQRCPLCGETLEPGTPGVQLSVSFLRPVRAHVHCAHKWRADHEYAPDARAAISEGVREHA